MTSLYDLMDSAYDAPQIHTFSRALGHVPIIDPNPRGGEKRPLAPAEARRFKERSASERVNSLLKERYGGRWLWGARKVMCHLMFGLVALTATALFARVCVEARNAHRWQLATLKLAPKTGAIGRVCLPASQNRWVEMKTLFFIILSPSTHPQLSTVRGFENGSTDSSQWSREKDQLGCS